jgi:hypothetical protein
VKKSVVPRIIFRTLPIVVLLGLFVVSGCALAITGQATPEPDLTVSAKHVSFAVLEDYEKGDDLDEVAPDFALMNELEIDTMRTSFGWDNFEPVRGQYDFAWLEEFVSLADRYGIKLRPYIGYTPEWAAPQTSSPSRIWRTVKVIQPNTLCDSTRRSTILGRTNCKDNSRLKDLSGETFCPVFPQYLASQ